MLQESESSALIFAIVGFQADLWQYIILSVWGLYI